jgi:hypothetical protein
MTYASVRSHFAGWRRWEMNPVVIKELRQAVRSWAVTGMLLLFLIVLFVATMIFLIQGSFETSSDMQIGGEVFLAFMAILSGASILFIPLYTGVRMAAERQENNNDLLYISTLSPLRIIWGKFICGAYITLLFFSACMPFMAFTNLLRGVDLPTVFFLLAYLFVVVCAVNQLAIFVACLPITRPFKVLLGLGEFVISFWIIGGVVLSSSEMVRSGIGSMMADSSFWITTASIAGIIVMVTGLFFVLSVALISPPSANRALLPRIYVTMMWLISGLLAVEWVLRASRPDAIYIWMLLATFLLIATLVATVGNNDQLSRRVRRRIPKFLPLRAVAFLFFNGAAGGLVWVAALAILTYLVTLACSVPSPLFSVFGGNDSAAYLQIYPALMIYAFAYALTGLYIQRRIFPLWPAKMASVCMLLLGSAVAVGLEVVLFFANQLSWRAFEHVQPGNAANLFAVSSSDDRMIHLYTASAWLAIALAFNARWFFTQLRKFRPPEPIAVAIAD